MFKLILDRKRSVNAKLGSGASRETFIPLGGAAANEELTIHSSHEGKGSQGSCEKIEDRLTPGLSVRRSARSTQVERTLRVRFHLWIRRRDGSGSAQFKRFTASGPSVGCAVGNGPIPARRSRGRVAARGLSYKLGKASPQRIASLMTPSSSAGLPVSRDITTRVDRSQESESRMACE
jgi:hypothetical protein